jgi:hypothetical protein
MNEIKRFLRSGLGLVSIAAAALVIISILSIIIGGVLRSYESAPLWTETSQPALTSTIDPGAAIIETPPYPAGSAATLFNGDIWLVEPGVEPQALTNLRDVSAIFGWNRDSTRLLLGRGSTRHPDAADTTDLWLLDIQRRQTIQLTFGQTILSAAWSPVDDYVSYCDENNVLTVTTQGGELVSQIDKVLCGFTWSPDGAAIAVSTYTMEMIDNDGLQFTVLGVWWLVDDRLQVFSNARDEVQIWPIWSIDGQVIVFQRISYDPEKYDLGWWHILNVTTGETVTLGNSLMSAEEISRSPYSDRIVFRLGQDIYLMDFAGRYEIIGEGSMPIWLPSGNELLIRTVDGSLQIIDTDVVISGEITGGQRYAYSVNMWREPQFFFMP